MELLAPAGNMEAFIAAVENGADAVYLGGKLFNARQSADNFSIEEIAQAVRYAHLRGVKVYITINILLADTEFQDVVEYINDLMKCEIDAVIIQDIGLLSLIKFLFPHLPIHASTQMTLHNSYGAKWFAEEGFERLVLARELSLEEIKNIARSTRVELETFVHGALCISYSGQCLFSSMIGGRSGNRGRCAQPCRMSYKLVNEQNKQLVQNDIGEHLLSPKDLNASEILPKLDEAGITSLKIEGRMKRPEYVATVIRVYRAALNRMIDGELYHITSQEKKDLAQIFNREFTTGYYLFNPGRNLMSYKRPNNRGTFLGRIVNCNQYNNSLEIKLEDELQVGDGLEIWVTKGGREGFVVSSILVNGKEQKTALKGETVRIPFKGYAKAGDRLFKTSDVRLQNLAKESYTTKLTRLVPVDVKVQAILGEPMQLTLTDEDGNKVNVRGEVPSQIALKTQTTPEMLQEQIGRMGNTPFKIVSWRIEIEPGIMIPKSEMNAVRRAATENLQNLRLQKALPYKIHNLDAKQALAKVNLLKDSKSPRKTKLSIAVVDFEGFKAAALAEPSIIYVGGEQFRRKTVLTKDHLEKIIQLSREKGIVPVFALPRIWHDHEVKYLGERIKIAADAGFTAFQVATPAGVALVKEIIPNAEIFADYAFNIFNSYALDYIIKKGIRLATLSPELTAKQIKQFNALGSAECIVFGNIPLMISEHCALGSNLGGRSENTKCNYICKENQHFLEDRMKFKFPVFTDMACRMHIYNAKVLNMLPNLEEIVDLQPAAIRLDLRTEEPNAIKEVAFSFAKALRNFQSGYAIDTEKLQSGLGSYFPQGFTKGHYYRGIIDTEE